MIACHIAVSHTLGIHEALIPFTELLNLTFLISKGFYHPDSGKAILDLTIDLTHTHTILFKCAFHFLVVDQRVDQHDDHNGKTQQRHLWLYIQKNDQRSEQLDHGDQNILRSMMKKLGNVKKVTCNTGKQLSYLLVIVECKRKLLIMAEDFISHIVLNISTHHMTIIGDKIAASQLHQDQQQHSHTYFQNDSLSFHR